MMWQGRLVLTQRGPQGERERSEARDVEGERESERSGARDVWREGERKRD